MIMVSPSMESSSIKSTDVTVTYVPVLKTFIVVMHHLETVMHQSVADTHPLAIVMPQLVAVMNQLVTDEHQLVVIMPQLVTIMTQLVTAMHQLLPAGISLCVNPQKVVCGNPLTNICLSCLLIRITIFVLF